MCTLIPKHRLILQFSWFGDEIRLSICQKIPADYYIRVCHRKYSHGNDGSQTTENMVFLISKDHNWNFRLNTWFDIESEKEAINGEYLMRKLAKTSCDGRLVFGGKPPNLIHLILQRYIITIVVPIIFIFVIFSI